MSTATTTDTTPTEVREPSTRFRIGLLALALTITSLIAIPGGLLFPEPAAGGDTYAYSDIAPVRDRWWTLLVTLSVLLVLNLPAQALASMTLVRRKGSGWVTTGGALMWAATALQTVGVAGWAAAYYFATAPGVDQSVVGRINDDTAHLFGLVIAGALLAAVGTVVQGVGLLRSRVLPRWVPIASMTVVLTFVLPNSGPAGLVTSVPMTAGAIALAWFAWKRVR